MKNYEAMTVAQIVVDNFSNATVFGKFGIDFCCNGGDSIVDACRKCNVEVSLVLEALMAPRTVEFDGGIEFKTWSLDLLCDYILKYHHRNIRHEGPVIEVLLDKVCEVHSEQHPELVEIRALFAESLIDLYNHLEKEERVLFPYIYEMYDADQRGVEAPALHCGTIAAPISVMMSEHNAEGERYHKIEALTNGYQTPNDVCHSYKLLMNKLKAFNAELHQHIHLENNIVFPIARELEHRIRS